MIRFRAKIATLHQHYLSVVWLYFISKNPKSSLFDNNHQVSKWRLSMKPTTSHWSCRSPMMGESRYFTSNMDEFRALTCRRCSSVTRATEKAARWIRLFLMRASFFGGCASVESIKRTILNRNLLNTDGKIRRGFVLSDKRGNSKLEQAKDGKEKNERLLYLPECTLYLYLFPGS